MVLNFLLHNLRFWKSLYDHLRSRYKQNNLLCGRTHVKFHRIGHQYTLVLFIDHKFVYCRDFSQFQHEPEVTQHESKNRSLFIDRSKWSLKCVQHHNSKQCTSVPLLTRLHWSRIIKWGNTCWRKYVIISLNGSCALTCILWFVLLGQLYSYTHYPCFLHMCDTKDMFTITQISTGLCEKNGLLWL